MSLFVLLDGENEAQELTRTLQTAHGTELSAGGFGGRAVVWGAALARRLQRLRAKGTWPQREGGPQTAGSPCRCCLRSRCGGCGRTASPPTSARSAPAAKPNCCVSERRCAIIRTCTACRCFTSNR
ncbi:hypothetical protein [Gordoniibacillus kamchatkensis]|uniref:hypothetical protein n=1 Tax=Gordoniibacillus kamchatkensis TaxID=1590651 RepID=UPI000698DD00|nr:hypothetical protein [Paenibacillus sp. VKM B-2647]